MTRESIERVAEEVASKVTYTGAGGTILGMVTSSQFIALIGLFLAIAGFLVNWHYKQKHLEMKLKEHHRWMERMRLKESAPAPLEHDE